MRGNYLLRRLKSKHNSLRKRENIGWRNIFRSSFIILTFLVFTVVVGFFIYWKVTVAKFEPYFANPSIMLAYKTDTLTFYDRNGKLIYRTPGRYNTKLLELKEISPHLVNATLAAEDKNFYQHDGFSLSATARAILNDIKQRDLYHQGGSTITQQVARTLFLSNDKSVARKVKEMIIATEIERRYTKDEILDLYLNSVYYGADAYGVADAAQTYFGKEPKDLNLSEASLLAGLAVAPSRLSPTTGDRERAIERQHYVLDLMEKKDFSSKEDIEKAKKAPLNFAASNRSYTKAPHFVLYLRMQLEEQFPNLDLNRSGVKVYTTLDLDMQERAERIVKETVTSLHYRNLTNGAFLATNPKTGEILAMAGSVDFNQKQWGTFNVLTANRSPGSSIKPLIYAAALEAGSITPATILQDKPTVYRNDWETYSPKDWDNKFRGPVLPRRALANSLNVPAVEVLSKTGLPKTIETVSRLGITGLREPSNYGLSFAVGGQEIKAIDLAAGFQVLANGGDLVRPWGLVKVEDKFGKKLYQSEIQKHHVLDSRISYILTNILSDNDARRESFGHRNPLEIGRPAAVKTGTGEDFKNAWTIGYTPSLLALVWVGNNDQSPMRDIWGGESAAIIWNRFMTESLANTPVENFSQPEGLETASICTLDGSRAVAGMPSKSEIFLVGTAPKNMGSCGFFAERRRQEERRFRDEEEKRKKKDKNEDDGTGGPINPDPPPPPEEEEEQ